MLANLLDKRKTSSVTTGSFHAVRPRACRISPPNQVPRRRGPVLLEESTYPLGESKYPLGESTCTARGEEVGPPARQTGPTADDVLIDHDGAGSGPTACLLHAGISSATIVGSSMGGRVAMELAGTRPDLVSSLVLLCAAHRGGYAAGPPRPSALGRPPAGARATRRDGRPRDLLAGRDGLDLNPDSA